MMKKYVVLFISLFLFFQAGLASKEIIVAGDGSGDFVDIQTAVNSIPSGNDKFIRIRIRKGVYKGHIEIPSDRSFLHFKGENRESVIITDDRLCGDPGDGRSSWYRPAQGATIVINAPDCVFENITFENSWGFERQTGPQALAVYSNNDRIVFNNCTMRSFQDTYLTSTRQSSDRHYLVNCRIEGAVDFIYGGGNVLFDRCEIFCTRKQTGYIVAPNHKEETSWGYVFLNCQINGKAEATTYLGRPWHNSPKTVFIDTKTTIAIDPRGWHYKMGAIPVVFADYNTVDSNGNPIDLSKRISDYEYDIKDANKQVTGVQKGKAKHFLTSKEAKTYTLKNILQGNDHWNPQKRRSKKVKL